MSVSVVLPVYNAATTIARAIQSILYQSHREFELIVVDDGSTDATVQVVRSFSDQRIKLIEREHGGVVAAANAGTRTASGALIARMDADDFSHASRLAKQIQLLEAQSLDVVGCQVCIVGPDHRSVSSMQRYQRWINEETLSPERIAALRFVEFPLVNPTILARREYFELQFRDGEFPEDYDLMLRAASSGMRFGKVNEILFEWLDHPLGLTRTHSRYSDRALMNCRRQHLLSGPLAGTREVDLWGLGKTGKPWLRWLQSQNVHVRRGYEVSDRKIGKTIHGVEIQHTSDLQTADGTPLIIAVGAAGAREDILSQIAAEQFRIGTDAWFVA